MMLVRVQVWLMRFLIVRMHVEHVIRLSDALGVRPSSVAFLHPAFRVVDPVARVGTERVR